MQWTVRRNKKGRAMGMVIGIRKELAKEGVSIQYSIHVETKRNKILIERVNVG